MTICFCTLAIHEPYRRRARALIADLPQVPWTVLTDVPEDFADLSVRAVRHAPTGPMAIDYLQRLPSLGGGAAAYHDKRFALIAALREFDTAVFLDADSRVVNFPEWGDLPTGISVRPEPRRTISEHLALFGSWRRGVFEELASYLTGNTAVLDNADWCQENFLAVTKDGHESRFFDTWGRAADFLQSREVYSGEGGVIGLAAACAGWKIDYDSLRHIADSVRHENAASLNALPET